MSKEEQKQISNKIKDVFKLRSWRLNCPSCFDPKETSASKGTYTLEYNYCHKCEWPKTQKDKGNIPDLISKLSVKNPRIFKQITSEQAKSIMDRNNIPEYFYKKMTRTEYIDAQKKLNGKIGKFLKEVAKEQQGEKVITEDVLRKLKQNNIGLPEGIGENSKIYFQKNQRYGSLTIETTPGEYTNIGSPMVYSPYPNKQIEKVIIVDSPAEYLKVKNEIINSPLKNKVSITTKSNYSLDFRIKATLKLKTLKTIELPDNESFDLILESSLNEGMGIPEIQIKNGILIPATTREAIEGKLKKTRRQAPEGVNYLNINDPKEYDDLIDIGISTFEMSKKMDKQTQARLKTGAISTANLFSGTEPTMESKFNFNDFNELNKAIELLGEAYPQTDNIKAEINLFKSLTPKQARSMDLQLQMANMIKEELKGEFYGVKGSANNLNILYLMGISSISPANDELLSPTFFLDPETDKNPDIDFELSPAQIERVLRNIPELTKGLSVTTVGDRIHVCKYFIDGDKQYNGKYIPMDSKEIERGGATPIDLLSSSVMTRMNNLANSLGKDKKEGFLKEVKYEDLFNNDLPHFNDNVKRQAEITGLYNRESKLNTEELAHLCALNRPVFYYSMIHLSKEENGVKKDYYFSFSGKSDAEAIYGLNAESEEVSKTFTQRDLAYLRKDSKKIKGYKIERYHSNYLTNLPEKNICQEEELLESTKGVITYQDQLFLLLKKYTSLNSQEINDIIKVISHPSKVEEGKGKAEIVFNNGTPPGIRSQISFITSSQNAFFFKKGHALFLGKTAQTFLELKLKSENKNIQKQENQGQKKTKSKKSNLIF